jgi:hypothetical protein
VKISRPSGRTGILHAIDNRTFDALGLPPAEKLRVLINISRQIEKGLNATVHDPEPAVPAAR